MNTVYKMLYLLDVAAKFLFIQIYTYIQKKVIKLNSIRHVLYIQIILFCDDGKIDRFYLYQISSVSPEMSTMWHVLAGTRAVWSIHLNMQRVPKVQFYGLLAQPDSDSGCVSDTQGGHNRCQLESRV